MKLFSKGCFLTRVSRTWNLDLTDKRWVVKKPILESPDWKILGSDSKVSVRISRSN